MVIELVKEEDLEVLSALLQKICKESFKNYYPQEWIDYTVKRQTVERLKDKANRLHFYVAKIDSKIVGCAAIGDYYGKEDESCLFSFFVDNDFQGQGVGKALMKCLEKDEYYTRAKRIEVPSSIPALPFYLKMGYKFKDNKMLFCEGSFALEKFNRKKEV